MTHSNSEDAHAPESSKPIDPQQRARRESGQSLGEEEEGHRAPVF